MMPFSVQISTRKAGKSQVNSASPQQGARRNPVFVNFGGGGTVLPTVFESLTSPTGGLDSLSLFL
jgi:hypothetical protein